MKIIFMGTPKFSVPALTSLINFKDHQVVSIFTQKPKAKSRGLNETISPVHEIAQKCNIPVYMPTTLKSLEAADLINSIDADIIVVVAYGFIIPQIILESKKYGCLNIHPSKLPKYRGAAPLQRTIINGEYDTAVCIMQMDAGLDTGDIILQEEFLLPPHIILPELHDKCADLGAELLIEVLKEIDTLPRIPQQEIGVSYAHKLTKEEGKINWNESAYQIDCKIRGMNPWPGTYFEFDGKIIKVLGADYKDLMHNYQPGFIINDQLEIACGKGVLLIKKLQQAGKSPLSANEFLRGFPILPGNYLK